MNTENVWKSGLQAAKLLSGSRLQIVFLLKKEPMSEKQLAGCMDEDVQGVGTELCVLQAVGWCTQKKRARLQSLCPQTESREEWKTCRIPMYSGCFRREPIGQTMFVSI